MVSVKQVDGEYPCVKVNAGSEQSKCHQVPSKGIKTHLYQLGSPAKVNIVTVDGEQSLLDALLLSQWEDRSCKGQFAYDVTMCETKIIGGRMELIAQLNENWNSNFIADFENNSLHPIGLWKPSQTKILRELLFCIASDGKESSELTLSTALPKEGTLVMVNVNPIEYGHVFLVPYDIYQRPTFLDKKMLYLILQFAREVNSLSLRIFFDHNASAQADYAYFQAGYFANPLPVELFPTVSVYGCMDNEEVNICELADYPLKALVFVSQNMELLVGLVAEICSILQHNNNLVFNLLVSDCATKVFLFAQACLPEGGTHLTTWECGGYFVYNNRPEFDCASEPELSKGLSVASLDDKGFLDLKQLCCNIACKVAP